MDKGIRRRDFFKVIGAGGAATATLAACADKPEKLIPYLLPPDNVEFVPGRPLEYATTCMECPAHCGMVVKTREARAIKAEGNPDHLVSQGALCIRGQATLQTHYNPMRIASAMQRQGNDFTPMEWDAAEAAVAGKLKNAGNGIVYMTGNVAGTRAEFLDAWLGALGASPKVVLDTLTHHSIRAANKTAFRRDEVPQYRIGEARFLLNFGSDFLETWMNPVENGRGYTDMHAYDESHGGKGGKGKFVHVSPHTTLTGANADQWVNVKPGSEAVLALALAREVISGKRIPGGEKERLEKFLTPYTLQRAAEDTGADPKVIKILAREFAQAEPSLALAGGTALATTEGTRTQLAVNILNYVAGNIGKTVRFGASIRIDPSSPYRDLSALINRMLAGEVKVLIVDGANPLYQLPASSKIGAALGKVETIVSLSSAWDETTRMAHLVLPGQSSLERWGDAFPQKGVFSLVQPVMASIYPVKSAEDTLLSLAAKAGVDAFSSTPAYRDYLREAWRKVQKAVGAAGDFEEFWRSSLQTGGAFRTVTSASSVRLDPAVFTEEPEPQPSMRGEGMVLLPVPSLRHRDGKGASNPWLQEIPDPLSQVVWDSWADINPATGKKMGIAHGESIKVTSPQGTVELGAYYHYGVNENVIAIALGQGHTASGRNADHVGVNVLDLLPSLSDRTSGDFAFLTTRVKVEGTGKHAGMVLTSDSPRQLGRGIIQTQSLADARAGKAPEKEGGGHAPRAHRDFYPPRQEQTPGYYDPYRWGMVVDSDRCTGCSACVAACYSENNLAIVGKTRAGLGREMAWITIQRFLEGKGDDVQTLMQPMFCAQCSNAGCEPVCPVYATYHNPEGINAQIYNRCVGTRYCSNNCPYKVRRFNYFQYEWESPLHMQLNPDVSVRSKGVMEKCTFCLQRINLARQDANEQGRNIADGEVTPACAQTCATKAITFGNLSDPDSRVSGMAMRGKKNQERRVRQYEVFPELKQLPAVTYLRKVTFESSEEA